MTPNLKAFLDMLSVSEGTAGKGDNGYNVLYGGGLFNDYSDHPRRYLTFKINGKPVTSSAAGRYQILARYYDAYKRTLRLLDFSPASQDAIAIQMIRERSALSDIEAGRIATAIDKCRNIWASLPGAGYGQHEQRLDNLLDVYKAAGGVLLA